MSLEALTTTTYYNMASNSNPTYVSKYGTITVLNRTNYAVWKPKIQSMLLAANAYDIATRTTSELAGREYQLD